MTRATAVVNGILRTTVARVARSLERPAATAPDGTIVASATTEPFDGTRDVPSWLPPSPGSVDGALAEIFLVLIAVGLPSGGGRPRGRGRSGGQGPSRRIPEHRGRVAAALVDRFAART